MKKIFLLITCISFLASCSEEVELINDGTDPASSSETSLRSSVDFFDASNMIPLYEYFAYSGGQIIDTYYSTVHKGTSFLDSQSGYRFTYQGIIGKVAKNPYPYKGISPSHFSWSGVQLFYDSVNKNHLILETSLDKSHHYGWRYSVSCDLGYILINLKSEDRAKVDAGQWDYLQSYTQINAPYYSRCFKLNLKQPEPNNSIWRSRTFVGFNPR